MLYPTTTPYPDPSDCTPEHVMRLPVFIASTPEELALCGYEISRIHHRHRTPQVITSFEFVGFGLDSVLNNDPHTSLDLRHFSDYMDSRYDDYDDDAAKERYDEISCDLWDPYFQLVQRLEYRFGQYRLDYITWFLEDFIYPHFIFRQGEDWNEKDHPN